jgi:hypothetical protein
MTVPTSLYQPLLPQQVEGVDEYDEYNEPYDDDDDCHHCMGPLHVDLDHQYHLVALAPPATCDNETGDEFEEEEDGHDDGHDDPDNMDTRHADDDGDVMSGGNSLLSLICLMVTFRLSSQFYMKFLLHNKNTTESSSSMIHHLSWPMAVLSLLLFALKFGILYHAVVGSSSSSGSRSRSMAAVSGGLRNTSNNNNNSNHHHCRYSCMAIMLVLIPAEVILDALLLLVIWQPMDPRLAPLLAGSLLVATCLVILSAWQLVFTAYRKADLAMHNKGISRRRPSRFLGSLVPV